MLSRVLRFVLLGCLVATGLGPSLNASAATPLTAVVNHPPGIPTDVRPDSRSWYGGDTTPYRIVTTTPTFVARVEDPDRGQRVAGRFRITQHGSLIWKRTSQLVFDDQEVSEFVLEGRLEEGVDYRLTVRGLDDEGARSAGRTVLHFVVDLTNPTSAPLVHPVARAPAVYVEDKWGGGVGVLGKFTFRDHGDRSVVEYHYGFGGSDVTDQTVSAAPNHHGRSTRVEFRPASSGYNSLAVSSVDAAGRVGPLRVYSFWVYDPQQKGRWDFSEGSGTTAADSSGSDHPLAVSPSTQWTDGIVNPALNFDELADNAVSRRRVVDTEYSFTVTARVRMDSLGSTGVVVSADGEHLSGFNLGYVSGDSGCQDPAHGCFEFWAPDTDTSGEPTFARARSPQSVHAGEWYFLMGTYNWGAREGQQLQLYTCNADRAEVETGAAGRGDGWRADGPLRVGQGQLNQAATDAWRGDVDTVTVYDGALSYDSVLDLCYGTP